MARIAQQSAAAGSHADDGGADAEGDAEARPRRTFARKRGPRRVEGVGGRVYRGSFLPGRTARWRALRSGPATGPALRAGAGEPVADSAQTEATLRSAHHSRPPFPHRVKLFLPADRAGSGERRYP